VSRLWSFGHHGFGSLSLKGTVHRGLSDCGEGRKQRRHSGCSADGEGCPSGDSPRAIVFVLLRHVNVPVRQFSVMQFGTVEFRSLFRTGRLRLARNRGRLSRLVERLRKIHDPTCTAGKVN
jgi:hypothetical protein